MLYDCVIGMSWYKTIEADDYKSAMKEARKEADDIMESLSLLGVDIDKYHKPEIEIVARRGDEAV